MRRIALPALFLTLAACGDSTGPSLGSLAGYWEGTSGDSVAVEVVIVGETALSGCASFRWVWMGPDSRETIAITGSVDGLVVTLSESPGAWEWTLSGERVGADTITGESIARRTPARDDIMRITLARTSTGGTCGVRALP